MTEEQRALAEERMDYVERCFERIGAVPQDINRKNREMLGQRQEYLYNGSYYRVDVAEFDGVPFLIIDRIDDEKFAAVGIMEDVEALPLTLSDAELEAAVRGELEG